MFRSLVALAITVSVAAAPQSGARGSSSASGRVIDAITGRPVAGASAVLSGRVVDEHDTPVAGLQVVAWSTARRAVLGGGDPTIASASTDANGEFRIEGVAVGEYVLAARVIHYTLRQESADASSSCVPAVPPPPAGLPDVVEKPAPVAKPPDRPVGIRYSKLAGDLRQPAPLADGTRMTYRTVIYPGVPTVEEASVVVVGPGETRTGLDFRLQPVPAVQVTGELKGDEATRGAEVRLRMPGNPNPDAGEAVAWLAPGSGAFTFLDFPAGSYSFESQLYAAPPDCDSIVLDPESSLTTVRIEVPVTGVNRLAVPVVRGVTVTGSVTFKGSSRRPDYVDLRFLPLDTLPGGSFPIGTIENGRLAVHGVVPGSYELQASDNAVTGSWWLESVTAGGRDVTGLPIVIGADGADDVNVVMTDRPASVNGTVMTAANRPVADATVVLFPADRARWPDARISSLRFQTSRALRGVFDFANVPAGEYFIAPIDETMMDAWPSESFLQWIAASGRRITVRHASAQTVGLVQR